MGENYFAGLMIVAVGFTAGFHIQEQLSIANKEAFKLNENVASLEQTIRETAAARALLLGMPEEKYIDGKAYMCVPADEYR